MPEAEASSVSVLLTVAVVFALVLLEAWVVWTLASKGHERASREQAANIMFLQGRLEIQDGLLRDMADRVQFPTPQARSEAAKAKVEEKMAEALTPQALVARDNRIIEDLFWREERWRNHQTFANNPALEVSEHENGDMVITNYSTDPASMMTLDKGTFFLRFGRTE